MLSKFFLDRPVFAWVIAIVMMAAGGLAIYNLPSRSVSSHRPASLSPSMPFIPGPRRRPWKTP